MVLAPFYLNRNKRWLFGPKQVLNVANIQFEASLTSSPPKNPCASFFLFRFQVALLLIAQALLFVLAIGERWPIALIAMPGPL